MEDLKKAILEFAETNKKTKKLETKGQYEMATKKEIKHPGNNRQVC